jgi:hypothetical protein
VTSVLVMKYLKTFSLLTLSVLGDSNSVCGNSGPECGKAISKKLEDKFLAKQANLARYLKVRDDAVQCAKTLSDGDDIPEEAPCSVFSAFETLLAKLPTTECSAYTALLKGASFPPNCENTQETDPQCSVCVKSSFQEKAKATLNEIMTPCRAYIGYIVHGTFADYMTTHDFADAGGCKSENLQKVFIDNAAVRAIAELAELIAIVKPMKVPAVKIPSENEVIANAICVGATKDSNAFCNPGGVCQIGQKAHSKCCGVAEVTTIRDTFTVTTKWLDDLLDRRRNVNRKAPCWEMISGLLASGLVAFTQRDWSDLSGCHVRDLPSVFSQKKREALSALHQLFLTVPSMKLPQLAMYDAGSQELLEYVDTLLTTLEGGPGPETNKFMRRRKKDAVDDKARQKVWLNEAAVTCQDFKNMKIILDKNLWENPGWIRDHVLGCFVVLGLKSVFAENLIVVYKHQLASYSEAYRTHSAGASEQKEIPLFAFKTFLISRGVIPGDYPTCSAPAKSAAKFSVHKKSR